jgi:hypothetical protein
VAPRTIGAVIRVNLRDPVRAHRRGRPRACRHLPERTIATVETNWRATGRIWEYFDGDTGVGLGADAQTGWTATVANLIHEAYAAP